MSPLPTSRKSPSTAGDSTRNGKPAVLDRLHYIAGHFQDCQSNGQGYKARCPAHDDNRPSLSIGEGADGRILVHCFAGCATEAILELVGLRLADLMPGAKWIKATYDYRDASGQVLYQSVRYEPKDFRCRRPDGNGGWTWKKVFEGIERVPYRLPELLSTDPAEPVFIVEGEKDADRVASLGLTATTNVCGAGKWRPEYNPHFAGRNVVLLPDNDDPGRDHVADVLRHLAEVAASIKLIELPGLPEKGDVSDWLDAGGTREELLALVEQTTPQPNSVIQIIPEAAPAPPGEGGNSVIKIIPVTPPVLGEAAYLGFVGEFLRTVAPHTEATDAGVLAHLLPAIGTLVGPHLYVWAGNKQAARVNTVLVGPTNAGRKGTAFAPVDLLMRLVNEEFWQAQRVNGLSSGEGLIAYVADKEAWNKETEQMDVIPVEKRLYVVEEEFSRVLANMGREGNILSQILRSCFDSGDLATLTVNPRRAVGAHISLTGHITPEELIYKMNRIEMANGWGNRFLWFLVKSDKIMPHTEPIPESVFRPFAERLRALSIFGATRETDHLVQLDATAKQLWEQVYPRLREDRPGLAGAMVSRGPAIVKRLALIYAVLECPLGKGKLQSFCPDLKRLFIRTDHLEAALAVWDYCEESARLLFAGKTGDPLGEKLLHLLATGPMTKDEFNRHLSPDQKRNVGRVLADLEAANRVRKVTVKREGPGRPAERWELVEPPGR